MTRILKIEDLTISAPHFEGGRAPIVSDFNLSLMAGQVVGLIGESGSGKTTVGLASLGYLRPGLNVEAGKVLLNGGNILSYSHRDKQDLRGNRVTYVAQSAAAAFNPSLSIGSQVVEPILVHKRADAGEAEGIAKALYAELDLPNGDQIGRRFPHEVSGGQLQRLMAAMALGTSPEVIVFDEPTTALDVTTQVQVLRAFKKAIRGHGKAGAIYISHDLPVVAQIADYIIVLKDGRSVEEGETDDLLADPREEYTRALLKASEFKLRPAQASSPEAETSVRQLATQPLLRATELEAIFENRAGAGRSYTKAVSGVSFEIRRQRILGVIGESGSGKSTLARLIAGLVPRSGGEILFENTPLASAVSNRSPSDLRKIQIVFQSADTALNPKHTIGKILGRVARQLFGISHEDARQAALEALDMVHLPASFEHRLPFQLSGGQKQRINLARAIIAKPEIIICDEVTSALDPVVKTQIVDLLAELKDRLGLSLIFISHDMSTVSALADDVLVMLKGEAVEYGSVEQVMLNPRHGYTEALLASVPKLRHGWLEEIGALVPPDP